MVNRLSLHRKRVLIYLQVPFSLFLLAGFTSTAFAMCFGFFNFGSTVYIRSVKTSVPRWAVEQPSVSLVKL
jgi:hypothetical protein